MVLGYYVTKWGIMRYIIGLLAITLVLTHCSGNAVQGEFVVQVRSFQKAAFEEGRGIEVAQILQHTVINLVDRLPGQAIGVCAPFSDTPMVMVLRSYWIKADPIHREALVWHELGHCVLHNAHNETKKPDGHPVSLMYPSIQTVNDENYYRAHRSEYQHELFHNKNKLFQ